MKDDELLDPTIKIFIIVDLVIVGVTLIKLFWL